MGFSFEYISPIPLTGGICKRLGRCGFRDEPGEHLPNPRLVSTRALKGCAITRIVTAPDGLFRICLDLSSVKIVTGTSIDGHTEEITI